jgi:hypothetical protein
MMGDKTLEPWENTGSGNPPFAPILGSIIQVGLAALHSVAKNDNGFYFLGDDRRIYFVQGAQETNITTINIANEIEGFGTIDDAQGNCFQFQGQNFYLITFPAERKSFCFNESMGIEQGWFELSSTSPDERYIGSSFVYFNNKNYVTNSATGSVYELSKDVFDEDGEEILRRRDTGTLTGEMFARPGKEITMRRLELIMETGVGGIDFIDESDGPFVMLQFSDDGGRTWSTEDWASAGISGDYTRKVEWHDLGSFLRRIFRFSMSDSVYWCIHGGAMDVEIGI